jgi:hypothetical protein
MKKTRKIGTNYEKHSIYFATKVTKLSNRNGNKPIFAPKFNL